MALKVHLLPASEFALPRSDFLEGLLRHILVGAKKRMADSGNSPFPAFCQRQRKPVQFNLMQPYLHFLPTLQMYANWFI